MNERENVTTGKMTRDLIAGFLIFGILGSLVYSFLFGLISIKISTDSIILLSIVALIIQAIIVVLVWQASTSSAFKKRTINITEVSVIMKNLIIFTIVLCLGSTVMNYFDLEKSINKAINYDTTLSISDSLSKYYSAEQKAEYEKQKNEIIEQAKSQAYTYFTVLEIGVLVIYLGALPLEKRFIMKKVTN